MSHAPLGNADGCHMVAVLSEAPHQALQPTRSQPLCSSAMRHPPQPATAASLAAAPAPALLLPSNLRRGSAAGDRRKAQAVHSGREGGCLHAAFSGAQTLRSSSSWANAEPGSRQLYKGAAAQHW